MAEPAAPVVDERIDDEARDDDRPRLVRFVVGDRELLADVASVLEVLVPGPVTRLPGAAGAIAGVTSVRGRIVAVVDASAALGTETPAGGERFLVVATPGGPVALLVDRVDAVVAAHVDPVTAGSTTTADDVPPPRPPLVVATATVDGRPIPVVDPAAVVEAAIGTGAP